jgi:Terminase large subunit, T4likevirus-type, N-terminal
VTDLPAVGLVEACDDERLFGIDLWPKQREWLEAVEQGPRIHVWACGRRSAKTTTAAIVGLWDCLFRPQMSACVLPGETRHAVALAVNVKQARLFVQQAKAIVSRSPLLADQVKNTTEDSIEFINDTVLSAFACSSRSARGWPISTLLLDEAAHFLTETDGPQTAEKVWEALVPSTAQFPDARIIVASTPYGEDGLFPRLFKAAVNGEVPDMVAQHCTTEQANPSIAAAFLALEQARDPDSFAYEYEAQFLGGGGAYLNQDVIDSAVIDRGELPPEGPS